MNFDDFKLHPTINANVHAAGYETPTPIQSQTIELAMAGRDLIGLAQTGTGKTAAFALPIIHRLLTVKAGRHHPRVLVVAPTRELAEQIKDTFVQFSKGTNLCIAAIYGGVALKPQLKALRGGLDIVVACPGRLLDHVRERTIDLSFVEVLVLDEADQMFDMGFLPDIRRILKAVPSKRQSLLFSATMPSDIHVLAAEALTDPQTVQIDTVKPTETVSHGIYPVESHLKLPLLFEVLKNTDTQSVLIFVAAKHRAKRIGEKLIEAGYKATSLQGNLSQGRRQEAITGFRNGTYQLMVATDVAARGIDIADISHVINFDMPTTLDFYTHRIGRTGRAAKTGDAFTFVTPEDYDMVQAIEKVLNAKIPRFYVDGFDYKAPPVARDPTFARGPRQPRPKPRPTGKSSQSQPAGRMGQRDAQSEPRKASPRPPAQAAAPRADAPRPAGPRSDGGGSGRPTNPRFEGQNQSRPSAQQPTRRSEQPRSDHQPRPAGQSKPAGEGEGAGRPRRRPFQGFAKR